jgi:hypothetical protein
MPDVLARVLGALCSELRPVAVAVGSGDQGLEDAITALLGKTGARLDLVEGPDEVAADVSLLVVPLSDPADWAGVAHAVTLHVGGGAFALSGGIVSDTSALLADYTDLRIEALERRLHEQAVELASLRAGPNADGAPAAVTPASLQTDRVAEKREAAAQKRFSEGYDPAALAGALGWEGWDIADPLPTDRRPSGTPSTTVVVEEIDSRRGLMRTAWSVLERARQPVALEIAVDESASVETREAATAIAYLGPHISVTDSKRPSETFVSGERTRLVAGDVIPPGWPVQPDPPQEVAFVLPGAPPGGSGGSHSVAQEVMGLNQLGIQTTLVVPDAARPRIEATYPEVRPNLADHADEAELVERVRSAEVIVATEHTSVPVVVAAARRTGALPAYYVQDYEAFFAPEGSERGDTAVLSYRAHPELRLFAKTHWLANLVTALHAKRVELVVPSIDRDLFHRSDRTPAGSGGTVRVCAMVRPRTPRRRPAATVRLLAALSAELGDRVEVVTFGCAAEELAALLGGTTPAWTHHGILKRADVARLLRGSDVFVDLSVYQAFGRTGCEAMASGAVPVLPGAGGVTQYATDGVNAALVDGGAEEETFATVVELVRDRDRLRALAEAGATAVAPLSIENSARSWASALGASLVEHRQG